MNIFEKMAAITAELRTVAKNLTVGVGNNKYNAVSERDVLDAVKPLEEKYGVYSYPAGRTMLESNMLETEKTYNQQTTKTTTFMSRIATVYRFVNIEKPDEYIETTTFAEGIDSQDKGSGKAMTYCDKYALMKAYKISTGDDPDQTASEDTNYKKAKYTKAPEMVLPAVGGKNCLPKTPRQQLFARLKELGIDAAEYAKEAGIDKTTPDDEIMRILADLRD